MFHSLRAGIGFSGMFGKAQVKESFAKTNRFS